MARRKRPDRLNEWDKNRVLDEVGNFREALGRYTLGIKPFGTDYKHIHALLEATREFALGMTGTRHFYSGYGVFGDPPDSPRWKPTPPSMGMTLDEKGDWKKH